MEGEQAAPDIDFNRILAKLVRHFHLTPDYCLDHVTFHDWKDVYGRELLEAPPPEAFLAGYFKYEPPGDPDAAPAEEVAVPQLADL